MFAHINIYGRAHLLCSLRNTAIIYREVFNSKRSVHIQNIIAADSPELALLLERFSKEEPRPLTLQKLLSFGSPLTKNTLIESASYALAEIPRRLVRRVEALESLPYIVTVNPFLSRMLRAYKDSFKALVTYPLVQNIGDNWEFTQKLQRIVVDHANDIPTMAKGFQECSRYMSSTEISKFLDEAIRSRIGIRLIAEQHIALTRALRKSAVDVLQDTGVVDMHCSPAQMVRMCSSFVTDLCEATLGTSPTIVIDGHVDVTFPYVPVHLEFALTELLKNAFRATVEHHHNSLRLGSLKSLPPVVVTISLSPVTSSTNKTPMLSIRIRDQGGGVAPANLPFIFSYAFTTSGRGNHDHNHDEDSGGGPYAAQQVGGAAAFGDGGQGEGNLFGEITGKGLQTGMGTLSGLGYGLPLAKLYAKYFGGDLQLVSLYNYGTDVFLSLRCLQQTDGSII